jgi:flagellar motor switch protein FliN/FliY
VVIDPEALEALKQPVAGQPPRGPARRERAADAAADSALASNGKSDRLLRIRVPVIAQLAARKMAIRDIRKLSAGAIIEFDIDVSEQLSLMINNRVIARGEAVRVGERFGLRLSEVGDRATRMRSMGQ